MTFNISSTSLLLLKQTKNIKLRITSPRQGAYRWTMGSQPMASISESASVSSRSRNQQFTSILMNMRRITMAS